VKATHPEKSQTILYTYQTIMSASSPQQIQTQIQISARTGKAIPLPKNHTIRITNTHGTQVVDFWAFTYQPDTLRLTTYLSTSHTRSTTLTLSPTFASSTLYSNLRTPILRLTADTSPGVHDTLIAACDPQRYRLLGIPDSEEHASCAMNLRDALREDVGIWWRYSVSGTLGEGWTPDPLNLFMNIPVNSGEGDDGGEKGELSFQPPVSKPGDYVELMAVVDDVVVVLSCCPQDRVPVNGEDMVPRGVEVSVFRGDGRAVAVRGGGGEMR
jgi:uncharacterized protein YcgI (DUF1989 family)